MTTIAEAFDLTGRVALVTGAGRGLGRAISARLAEAGATVVCADIDHATATETAVDHPGRRSPRRSGAPRRHPPGRRRGARRPGRRRPGSPRRDGEQRRDHRRRPRARHDGGGARPRLRGELQGRVLRLPGRGTGDGAAGLGVDHQPRLGRDRHPDAHARLLRDGQGRGRAAVAHARDGAGAAAGAGERDRARLDRHADERASRAPRPTAPSTRRSRPRTASSGPSSRR